MATAPLDWSQCPAVESIPGKVSGAWVFRGTRMPVQTVFENLEVGMSLDEITEVFDVTPEEVKPFCALPARALRKRPSWADMVGGLERSRKVIVGALLALGPFLPGALLFAPPLHSQEQIAAIDFQLPDLDKLSRSKRILAIGQLALKVRTFSGCDEKVVLASELADDATDAPDETLQEVTTTFSEALRGCPGEQGPAYLQLARLVLWSHMRASLDDARLAAAMAAVEAEDREIQEADFTLADLRGKTWTLKDLRGNVVLLDFWQTDCGPCVEEIPALNALHRRFQKKGLVILAISGDDDATTVRRFLAAHRVSYPVLLDSGRKVTDRFHVVGIPRSIVFDRTGKLAAQVEGWRTRRQFAETLGQAGLR